MIDLITNTIIEIKRFFSYLIFRIYRYGIRVISSDKSWQWGGYFYLLLVISIIPSIISVFCFQNLTGFHFGSYFKSKITLTLSMAFFCIPIMFIFSLFIPFNYVKNLTYTAEERVKYRNVFLVLVVLLILLVVLRVKGYF